MDSKVVVGVGNIYAAEALFIAGIRPTVQACRVTRVGYERLAAQISQILARAIQVGGTTLKRLCGFRWPARIFPAKPQCIRSCWSNLPDMLVTAQRDGAGSAQHGLLPAMSGPAGWRLAIVQAVFLAARAATTFGSTNCEISPPIAAISRTNVEEINEQSLDVGRNTYSTSGANDRFISAI